MKQFILLLLFISLTQLSFSKASGANMKGIVTDEKNQPVPFATVVLKTGDSLLYKGEITNENGEFSIENIKAGTYFLQIQLAGFETLVKTNLEISQTSPTLDLGTLILHTSSKDLATVSIVGDKPFIEHLVDRTVVNIENSIVQMNSSILEVMEKLPGVIVDQDGKISLKGKQGVIIMIDGKPTGLSGQELANLLRGMPSGNIQKIEIITNPSAKYDAAGNAGIINIVMKKNRLQGFNGSVNAGCGQGRYSKYNGSLGLNYKKDWYNLFLNYSYSNRKGFNNLIIDRKFYDHDTLQTVFETNDYMVFPFETHAPRIGADFYLSKKTTLSLLGSAVSNSFRPSSSNHTTILDGHNDRVSSSYFLNTSQENWYNYTANAELTTKIDTTGQELTIDIDYAKYWNIVDQMFETTLRDNNDSITGINTLVGSQNGALYLYSAKADYSKPLKNKAVFEAGLKSSYVNSDNNMRFFDRVNNSDLFDTARSSHFLYSENINAAYLNYKKELKKISLQLGLRAEQTAAHGKQMLDGQTFTRNYLQVFPTLFFDYKINDNHDITLSLGRRVDRPGYDQMNPFKYLIDATTYSEGNPYLLPQLTYNSELSYSFKNTFFVTAAYSLTTDNITEVLIQDAATRTTIQAVVNLNKFNYASLNLVYTKKLMPWWTTNTSVLSYYGVYTGTINNYQINQGTPSFYLNTSNSFTIRDGLSMECSFAYNYKNLYGVTLMRTTYNLSAGIQKSLFKKRGSLTINFTDILWKAYPSGITQFGNVNEDWTAKRDTRVVNINFSYKFGKGQGARMRRKTGADDEKSRISNN